MKELIETVAASNQLIITFQTELFTSLRGNENIKLAVYRILQEHHETQKYLPPLWNKGKATIVRK